MVMVTKTSANDELPTSVPPPTTDESTAAAAVSQTSSDSDYSISITASCAQRIASLATKRSLSLDELYLRVFVDAGGCSGFQYQFELTQDKDEPVEEEDVVFVYPINNGDDDSQARVVVDQASLELIHGSTIDFVQEMIKSAFVVADNPQSESACGCGSSFAVKNFEANPALD
jgi:iron-sulfur cluster assembly accessory protein